MWRLFTQVDSELADVYETPYRWLVVEGIGWWLVNLSNHVILDRLGLYQLGCHMIRVAGNHDEYVTTVKLSEENKEAMRHAY